MTYNASPNEIADRLQPWLHLINKEPCSVSQFDLFRISAKIVRHVMLFVSTQNLIIQGFSYWGQIITKQVYVHVA